MAIQLPYKNHHTIKDQRKADHATKFIGRGSPESSTNKYAKAFGVLANSGTYTSDDVVFISAEGNRSGRLDPDWKEIDLAIKAKAHFITDNLDNRSRSYNKGERQVANYLFEMNYHEEDGDGYWEPKA